MDEASAVVPPERRYFRLVISGNPRRPWLPLVSAACRPLRYSAEACKAMDLAHHEAGRLSHNYVGTEHILLGLTAENTSPAVSLLQSLQIDVAGIRQQVEEIIGTGHQTVVPLPLTPRAKASLRLARAEALRAGAERIGAEHMLLGLIREGEGIAAQVLLRMGAHLNRVRRQLRQDAG